MKKADGLICLLIALLSASPGWSQTHTGSWPWQLEHETPQQTALEVLRSLQNEDYFRLYGLVSEKVVSDVKLSIAKANASIFDVDIDVYSVMTSEFGLRYGASALFDQIMAARKNNFLPAVKELSGENVIQQKFATSESAAAFDLSTENPSVRIYLIEKGGKWYLDNLRIQSKFLFPVQE